MEEKTIIHRHPIASYFILTFLISWGSCFILGGPKYLRGELLTGDDTMPMAVLMIAGPCLAGVAMTALTDGRAGLRDLFSRMFRWRVAPRWYAAAALTFPVLILAVLGALCLLVSPDFAPPFLAFGIPAGLIVGLQEETGWMGFAFPRMQARFGTWRAAIILALLHGTWHLAADLLGASRVYGVYWLPRFVAMRFFAMTAMTF